MGDHFEIVNGGTRVVTLRGELDAHDAPALRTMFSEAVEGAPAEPRVVLDLAQVTFLDSTALGCIVGLLRRVGFASCCRGRRRCASSRSPASTPSFVRIPRGPPRSRREPCARALFCTGDGRGREA